MIRRGSLWTWLLAAVVGGWWGSSIAPAWAQEDVAGQGLMSVEIHGFASQGFIVTTDNNYLVTDTERGSFQLSEAGINFTKHLTSRLRMGIQLFAQNFGATGSYDLTADWFFLDYQFRDWLGVRAGRLKLPFGLFNEINDIDSARLPVLLPQSVYPLQARNFLFSHTGTELYGFARSRWLGALEYRLFGGTIFIDPALLNPPHSSASLAANVPFVMGGRLLWETPLSGLRVGGSLQKVRLDVTAYVPMLTVTIENNTFMWVASTDYTSGSFSLAAEYSRWHTEQAGSIPSVSAEITNERAYVMASYGITRWLQTGAYYALFFPDTAQRDGEANRQHDVALTVRFDLNEYWLLKFEGHFMAGAAGLTNPLVVNPIATEVEDRWGVFLMKTTVSF